MPFTFWPRYFLEAQGYGINESMVYEDNQSAILPEKNGQASSSKRTKHINIRYFSVTDRIAQNNLSVEWCPSGDLISDFMTKTPQGGLFNNFRDLIKGVTCTTGKRYKDALNKIGVTTNQD